MAGAGLHNRSFLSSVPPSRGEYRVATLLLSLLAAAFVAAMPFASIPAGRLAAFLPAYESALIICDLITSVLLIGQFMRSGSCAVLVLGGGYLFDALMIVAHALSFPGLFSDSGLLGAGEQTTVWLYVFWHAGFPVYVLAYAGLRRRRACAGAAARRKPQAAWTMIASTVLLATCFGVLAFPRQALLPSLIQGLDHTRLLTSGVGPAAWLLSVAAFLVLWRVRRRSVLDLWLTVAMGAWVMDVALAIVIGTARFDWGFYLSRSYGLASATVVLSALLLEMNRLYRELATALDLAEARNSELARSREDLARAQRLEAVGQLTGGVAHDFNNILTVICGNVELIQHRADLPPQIRRLAENVLRAAERGARITDQLLTFARRKLSRPETVNLNQLLTEFTGLMRQAVSAQIDLVLALAPDRVPARVDVAQFEAAILNLVVNARDAMPEGGRITIASRIRTIAAGDAEALDAGSYAEVSVSDTGEGMAPEVQRRVFEPFFTTKDVGRGSGLGLSQVYGFVTGAGGAVMIDSSPGQGTRLRLLFPLATEAPRRVEQSAGSPSGVAGNRTILIVEDDALLLELASAWCRELGYDVLQASNGADALAVLEAGRVDLLFSDVALPGGMNGVQLARRARSRRPELPVLLATGYSGNAFENGQDDFIVLRKPYSGADLAQRLRHLLPQPAGSEDSES